MLLDGLKGILRALFALLTCATEPENLGKFTSGPIMYSVVCKALTINVVTGEKAFIIWAHQEQPNMEDAVQMAKDELRNRICLGMPILQNVGSDENVKTLTSY